MKSIQVNTSSIPTTECSIDREKSTTALKSLENHVLELHRKIAILSEKIKKELNFQLEIISQYPNEDYKKIKLTKNNKILLFVYGSLMDKSAKDRNGISTIDQKNLESHHSAIAFGIERLYNYRHPADLSKITTDEKEKACLNIIRSSKKDSYINGALIEIDETDLKKLIEREIGYGILQVPVADLSDVQENKNPEITKAYTFMALDEPCNGITYTSSSIKPIRNYVKMVDTAAHSKGEIFYEIYKKTTCLADGKTPFEKWDPNDYSC